MGWTKATMIKVAKRTGYPVVEAWSGHNKGTMGNPLGPMLHHTGTPSTAPGDYPTLRIVRDGRAGLENSLCAFGLGRSGTIYLINNNISWHAGVGSWKGVSDGNGRFLGIEAEGPYTTWPAKEMDAYHKLVASILMECGTGTEWAPAHKEFALPRGRKPDPNFDMVAFRANVQRILNNPALLTGGSVVTPPAASSQEGDDEDTMYIRNSKGMIVHLTPMWARAIDPTTWKGVQAAGLKAVQYSDADFDEMIAAANGVDIALRHLDKMIGDHVVRSQEFFGKTQGV
jgi:hypothetical protein